MVPLSAVQSSNALILTTLPVDLVAVFVGATSGIGETTLKQFAKHVQRPRAYLVGRSQDAADRIIAECHALNPAGQYVFVQADVSLIRAVDDVCAQIKAKETALNVLFLSAGFPSMDRRETSEHLQLLAALTFYSRMRFITNLLPLLQRGTALRRVVTVGGGGLEGRLDASDFAACRVPLTAIRGHLCTLISLGLESVAKVATEVSFVHDFPGTVITPLFGRIEGVLGVLMRAHIFLLGRWISVPIEECGERHLYLATSARFPPAGAGSDGGAGVPLRDGVEVARGTSGKMGSGVYSVCWDGASASPAVEKLLAGYRDKGLVEEIWRHTESEFKRITGQSEGS